tara:strand:+ start:576 stop:1031 length:456 start_codon:yes stop_codon:yes gene_type:complete
MIEENNLEKLSPKLELIVQAVSKGLDLKETLIALGYSAKQKSIESQMTRLNKNPTFVREMQKQQENIIENKLIAKQLDKDKILSEYYQLYQELRADNDASNAIKCLTQISQIIGINAENKKEIKHEHKISFENILNDMRKGIENKPMISIN